MFGPGRELYAAAARDFDDIVSLALWVRPAMRYAPRMGLVDRDGRWGMFIYEAGDVRCSMYGARWIAGPVLPLESWSHVACVTDGMTVRLYVNGAEVASISGASRAPGMSRIQIGQNCCDGRDEFRGELADVRFYRRVLSSSDVAALARTPPP